MRAASFLGLVVSACALLGTGPTALADEVESVWPPTGPTWETEPAAAFEKARREGKGVLVYVATEACPHCVVMARTAWPTKEVVAASRDVVMLAVYRHARTTKGADAPKGASTEPEWVMRLDVMGYPQVRLLDGWGRVLPSSDAFAFVRGPEDVVKAIGAAKAERERHGKAPAAPQVPAGLLAKVAKADRDEVARPEPWLRAPAWRRAVEKGGWKTADLSALWTLESDPFVREAVLAALPEDADPATVARLVGEALDGPNDYVRRAAIRTCARLGGEAGVAGLVATIEKAVAGRTAWKNPNNVLCDAVSAAKGLPDPRFVPVLGRLLAKESANNSAVLLAVEVLIAVGKAKGLDTVKPLLLEARDIEGALQPRIREKVDAALKE